MKTTALTHKVSDAIHMRIDKDVKGWPVIEIEFKFVHYRLVIDNQKTGEKLQELLGIILNPKSRTDAEQIERPKFYKEGMK